MMQTTYKLSIIIPTKNRQEFCKCVIKQIIDVTSASTELVIQDNSDDCTLGIFVQELKCERIVYHYENKTLSFVDNFSEAIKLSHGEYVCMIGDDDGVLSNIECVTAYAKEKNLDALIPGLNSVYMWPTTKPIVKGGEQGYLVLSYIRKNKYEVNLSKALSRLLKNGCQDYQSIDMPRLYHGIVHRRILNAIFSRIGSYFGGLTPDMYMAVALALVCKKVEKVNFPITVSGICPLSGSAASATGTHTGELSDAPHFRGHDYYEWDKRIPAIYTVETIWADTALHALVDFEREDLIKELNILQLDARIWMDYSQFRNRVVCHATAYEHSKSTIVLCAYLYKFRKLYRRVWKRITRHKNEVIKKYEVVDIVMAADITIKEVRTIVDE